MHFLILLVILISCITASPISDNVNRLGTQTAHLVQKRLPLFCDGIGRTLHDGKIESIDLSFVNKYPMTIDEARHLLINAFKISFELIKQDKDITEHLINNTFEINNITISIYTQSFTTIEYPPEPTTSASIINSVIQYDRFDTQTSHYITIYEETYEEALQKCAL